MILCYTKRMRLIRSILRSQLSSCEGGKAHLYGLDETIRRLGCHQYDEYPGIESNIMGMDYLYTCKFSKIPGSPHILALANEAGRIAFQDTRHVGYNRPLKGFQAHDNAIFDLAWVPGEAKLISGSGDQSAVLWALQDGAQLTPVQAFRGHTASVKTVEFSPNNQHIFATGSRDGSILIWDLRSHASKPDNVLRNAHVGTGVCEVGNASRGRKRRTPNSGVHQPSNSVTALVFQDEHTLISSGAGDGCIKMWDLRKAYATFKGDPVPKHRLRYAGLSSRTGFSNLLLDPHNSSRLFATCLDDIIYEYNTAQADPVPVHFYCGHECHSFFVKADLSPNGEYLLSGSSDDYAYIWALNRPNRGSQPLVRLAGHGAEVTAVAWSSYDLGLLVTCSDDVKHRVWRSNNNLGCDTPSLTVDGKLNTEFPGKAEIVESVVSQEDLRLHIRQLAQPAKKVSSGAGSMASFPSPSSSCIASSPKLFSTPSRTRKSGLKGQQQTTPRTPESLRKFLRSGAATTTSTEARHTSATRKRLLEEVEEEKEETSSTERGETSRVEVTERRISERVFRRLDLDQSTCDNETLPVAQTSLLGEPSPTHNLPNLIVDGLGAPCENFSKDSPGRERGLKTKKKPDWLTTLRKEKLLRRSLLTNKSSP